MCSAVLLRTVCVCVLYGCRGYILDLMEGGRKLIVFAHHKSVMDSISECLLSKVAHIIALCLACICAYMHL